MTVCLAPRGLRLPGEMPSSQQACPSPAHLSSMRTQRSLNCRGRCCLFCLLCHLFCRPNSSSWLRLSGSRRCGDRAGSSSSGGAVGVTEGAAGTAAGRVTGARLAEVLSDGGAGLLAAGLERATAHEAHMRSVSFTCDRGCKSMGELLWQEKTLACPSQA